MKLKVDGEIYSLNNELEYKEKLKIVESIIEKHYNFFYESNFEKNNVRVALDILGQYLCLGKKKEDEILSKEYLRTVARKELTCGSFNKDSEGFINEFKEMHRKQNPKKSAKKYQQSITHKLATIRIPKEKRVNREIKENPMLHTFILKDGEWEYEAGEYAVKIEINCFTEEDMNLPYVNTELPYYMVWCLVDEDNFFRFKSDNLSFDLKFKIKGKYEFNSVLVIWQDEAFCFMDEKINILNNIERI